MGATMVALTVLSVNALYVGALLYFLHIQRKAHEADMLRVYMLVDNAMSYLKASSIVEKVQTDAAKSQYDVQLAYMRDTMAKSEKQKSDQLDSLAPKKVRTDTGEEVDLNEYEVFT